MAEEPTNTMAEHTETRVDDIRPMANTLVEQTITTAEGYTYKLIHTKYVNDMRYDQEPERSRRSTLYGPDGNILCVSPPHLSSAGNFLAHAQGNMYVSEFVEGTLINVFYNPHEEKWDLMTKTNMGANTWFTRTEYTSFMGSNPEDGCGFVYAPQHTFRQMFIDAIGGMSAYDRFVDSLHPQITYSFVVQHSASPHTMCPVPAKLYFISYQEVMDSASHTIRSIPSVLQTTTTQLILAANPTIHLPYTFVKKGPLITAENWEKTVGAFGTNYGIVLTDESVFAVDGTSCMQTAVLTREYISLCELRGNDANLMYMCIRLMQDTANWKGEKTDAFLYEFPWFIPIYNWTRTIANLYICHLYNSYVGHFIHKSTQRYAPSLYYHMHQLHQLFIRAKQDNLPFRLTPTMVFNYMKTVSVSSLYAALTEEAAGNDMCTNNLHSIIYYY